VTLRDFPLFADQNIHADVVAFLRAGGFAVVDVAEAQLNGVSDALILARAVAEGRVVVSHDADFGTLAIARGSPVVGIVYLRPGHVGPEPTIDTLTRLLAADPDLKPPFLLVAKRAGDRVSIRVRSLSKQADAEDAGA
jgi:predicted nuclease of predicted toxin-antitoxin system